MNGIDRTGSDRSAERGVTLVIVVAMMVPLLAIAAAATTLMTGRNGNLLRSLQDTKARFAAEAGIADAVHLANTGALVAGESVQRDLGGGIRSVFGAELLSADGLDNDGDGRVDEADERAFWVVSAGYHGRAVKRLGAVIREPALPPAFEAAMLCLGTPEITTAGGAKVSGQDVNLDGTRGSPANDVWGIAAEPPDHASDLLAEYTQIGLSAVEGTTPVPSFGTVANEFNLPGLEAVVRSSATDVIPPGTWTADIGGAASNDFRAVYCPGDLRLSGGMTGAGVLLVSGSCNIAGSVHWDGLVIVLGDFSVSGTADIRGAVLQGEMGARVEVRGASSVRYSSEALSKIPVLLSSRFVAEDWREISRR